MNRKETRSAGLLLYRRTPSGELEVLLVHPAGPFWINKDHGAWSIPKGEYPSDESPWTAARREFEEELGHKPPNAVPLPLGDVEQRGGKRVIAFAVEGDLDPSLIVSNTFEMERPPRSGRMRAFPEIDRASWFPVDEARSRINPRQVVLLDRLVGYFQS